MAYVSYIAKREIEPTGYVKTGVDISAAAGDDSFNATSTNLSGLLDNQWIKVSGFANAANNGWFQVNGNSTTTKISQDTTTSLVTEAAGPSVTITGYKRGLDQAYNLEFKAEQADRKVKVMRSSQQPIGGGAPETVLYRQEVTVDMLTEVLSEASQVPQFREFLASASAGEIFTCDRYGTVASPVDPRQAILESADYEEKRVIATMQQRIQLAIRLLS